MSTTTPHPPNLAPDFELVRSLISERLGLWFSEARQDFLRRRLKELHQQIDPEGAAPLASWLSGPGKEAYWSLLIDKVTVRETSFFRYPQQFAHLQSHLIPALHSRATPTNRPLRLLSLGCATGEEPWSLVMAAAAALPTSASFEVVGVDLCQSALESARAATYPLRAIESIPPGFRTRFLDVNAAKQTFAVRPEWTARAQFRNVNLLDDAALENLGAFDLIACRNILIYFQPEQADQVLKRIHERLVPKGILLMGHAETMNRFRDSFQLAGPPEVQAYQRLEPGQSRSSISLDEVAKLFAVQRPESTASLIEPAEQGPLRSSPSPSPAPQAQAPGSVNTASSLPAASSVPAASSLPAPQAPLPDDASAAPTSQPPRQRPAPERHVPASREREFFLHARVTFRLGNYQQAAEEFVASIVRGEYATLSRLYLAHMAFSGGLWSSVIRHLTSIGELPDIDDGELAEPMLLHPRLLSISESPEIEGYDLPGRVSLILATAYLREEDFVPAERLLRDLWSRSPKSLLPRILLARCLTSMQRVDESSEMICDLLEEDPRLPIGYRLLGENRKAQGDLRAAARLGAAVWLWSVAAPGTIAELESLLVELVGNQDDALALRVIERALSFWRDPAPAHRMIARIAPKLIRMTSRRAVWEDTAHEHLFAAASLGVDPELRPLILDFLEIAPPRIIKKLAGPLLDVAAEAQEALAARSAAPAAAEPESFPIPSRWCSPPNRIVIPFDTTDETLVLATTAIRRHSQALQRIAPGGVWAATLPIQDGIIVSPAEFVVEMDVPSFPVAVMGNLLFAQEAVDDPVPLAIARRAGAALCGLAGERGWQPAYHRRPDGLFVARSKATSAVWLGGQTHSSAVSCLRWLDRLSPDARFRETSVKAVELLLRLQDPRGGWPALSHDDPSLRAAMHRRFGAIDLTHGATTHAMRTLLLTARLDRRDDCLAAVRRAGLFLSQAAVGSQKVGWAGGYDGNGSPLDPRPDLRATVHALHGLLYAIAAGGPDSGGFMNSFLRSMDSLHRRALQSSGAAPPRRLSESTDWAIPIPASAESARSEASWLVPEFNRLLLRLKCDILRIPSDPANVARTHRLLTQRAHEWSQAQSFSGLYLSSPDAVSLYDTPLFALCHFAFAQRHGVARALDQWAHWEDFVAPDRLWLSPIPAPGPGDYRP